MPCNSIKFSSRFLIIWALTRKVTSVRFNKVNVGVKISLPVVGKTVKIVNKLLREGHTFHVGPSRGQNARSNIDRRLRDVGSIATIAAVGKARCLKSGLDNAVVRFIPGRQCVSHEVVDVAAKT